VLKVAGVVKRAVCTPRSLCPHDCSENIWTDRSEHSC